MFYGLNQLNFSEKIGFPADHDSIDGETLADFHQLLKAIEIMKADFAGVVKLFEMEIKVDIVLLEGKMVARLFR